MHSEELINRIRAEEIVRFEVKKELEKNDKGSQSKLWTFLNSNFGLFILSSIVLGLISWGYTTLQTRSAENVQKRVLERRLVTEMRYRVLIVDLKIQDGREAPDSIAWRFLYDIEDTFHGHTSRTANGKTSETSFSPIFSEFSNRGVHSLFWEYASYHDKIDAEQNRVMETLLNFDLFLNKCITNDLDDQVPISNTNIDSLELKLEFFKRYLAARKQ
jgi:hypothetical protein